MMSDELIISQCSPTLAGIKTGSLFSCPMVSKTEIVEQIRSLNQMLSGKGLRVIPLRFRENTVLIYVYRPNMLKEDMSASDVAEILQGFGYTAESPEKCVSHLIKRIRYTDEFPHEIGLFLGYPPEDVRGFIENNARNEKFVGYWKVYGDEEKARCLFDMYRRCTDDYIKSIRAGKTIDKLAVKM